MARPELAPVAEHPSTPRWIRPVAVFAVGFVVTAAFQTTPGPGVRGEHLAVSVALVGLVLATAAVVRLAERSSALQMAVMVAAVLSSAALVGLQPNGPGFLGVFPAIGGAALRLPLRLSAVVVGVALAALAAAWALAGSHPVDGLVLNELAVLAVFFLSRFARRYRESTEQAELLIIELEASRGDQAQAAALAERQRLAREMHDVLAHSLSGLVLNLEGARLLAERDSVQPELKGAIDSAHRLAKTGLEEARRAIGMLRDDELPGPQKLAALAEQFQADTGAACTFTVGGTERELGSEGRLTLYRVAQEGLTNVRKHGRPEHVDLHLEYEAAGTRLTIEDRSADGERPPPGDGTGYGLTGMRERAALLGGSLTAGPTASGFRVELWVPA
ncbi:MAG: sensor histidine kinase [Acidimicrobiia bacterium]|nr:sensor histidine kinase [Acidimicrobiia bacterium]